MSALAGAEPDARLTLRPLDWIDSPQLESAAPARLAGTMRWFGAVELVARGLHGSVRARIAVEGLDEALAAMPDPLAERARILFDRLTAPRAPLVMGTRTVMLDQPRVMGILNCTPDSFSDGGKHGADPAAAAAAGVTMAEAGAAIVDVGGESTRPGAPLVWEGDEIARVEPVIARMARVGVAVSVDTRKAAVMEAALAAGAAMINDVSALLYDDRATAVAAASAAPVVLMHAPSQGSDPHRNAGYADVVADVFEWLEARIAAVEAAGIARSRIVADPGIGFGKSLADNVALLNALPAFHALGVPLLVGVSRKRMIGALAREEAADQRLGGSLMLATRLMDAGVQLLRVHDVAETAQAALVWRGLADGALTRSA